MREKNLFSTSSHMGKNTDGENRKSDFLQAFINLMSSSRKMNLQRDCQQVVYKICRATKKVFNLQESLKLYHNIIINVEVQVRAVQL